MTKKEISDLKNDLDFAWMTLEHFITRYQPVTLEYKGLTAMERILKFTYKYINQPEESNENK